MRRIFFTQEMKDAIVAGKKTMTTRDHQKELGDCRILHIDSELLLKEKYWLKLYQEVQKFLILGKLVGHVYA